MENENQNVETTPVVNTQETVTPVEPAAAPVAPVAPKKKNFLVPILIIAGVLLVGIIVGAIFLLPNLMFSGKKAIDNEITEIFSKTKNTLIDSEKYVMNYDLDKESLGFEGTLSIESDYKDDTYDFTKLKDYKLNYSGVIDKKENAASGVVTLSKNSTDLATMDGYITGKDMYVYMKEIFKKTIHMESDSEIKDLEFSKTQDMNDILKLIEKTESAFKQSIKEENITEEKVDNYKKVTYKFKTNELEKSIFTYYLNDKETIEILSKITNQSEEDVKKALQDEISSLDNEYNSTDTTIVLYLQGFRNEFKKTEITVSNLKLVIDKDNGIYKYELYSSSEKVCSGEYNEAEGIFTFVAEGINLKVESKEGTITLDFSYEYSDTKFTLNGVITNSVSSGKQNNNTKIDIKYVDGTDNINLTINNVITIEKGKKVTKSTQSNIVDINDLTDYDYQEIDGNFTSIISEIEKDICPNGCSSYGNYYDDYDYDYDYDYDDYELDDYSSFGRNFGLDSFSSFFKKN